ncbi:hypothetical protein D3C81_351930 [compost metagenome]
MSDIKTRIYFCGGGSTNIGAMYDATSENVCFLDSSSANLLTNPVPEDRFYKIPGTDGAGGNPAYMMPFAKKHAPEMLKRFEPGVTNIVVITGGGGSGSTIGPNIVDLLLADGHTVFVIMIMGTDSTRRIRNTMNTGKNLEMISQKRGEVVAVSEVWNTNGEAAADQEVLFLLDSIVALTDQQNERLDTMDVKNFIQYNNLTSVEPQLSTLTIHTSRAEAAAVLEPISVASLYTDATKDVPFGTPFVRTVGICPNEAKLPGDQLHFVINSVGVTAMMDRLEEERVKVNTTQSSFRQRRSIVTVDDVAEDGFIAD